MIEIFGERFRVVQCVSPSTGFISFSVARGRIRVEPSHYFAVIAEPRNLYTVPLHSAELIETLCITGNGRPAFSIEIRFAMNEKWEM